MLDRPAHWTLGHADALTLPPMPGYVWFHVVTSGQLADRLGYRSEAAFSRTFKRIIGVARGAIRRSPGERDRGHIAAAG